MQISKQLCGMFPPSTGLDGSFVAKTASDLPPTFLVHSLFAHALALMKSNRPKETGAVEQEILEVIKRFQEDFNFRLTLNGVESQAPVSDMGIEELKKDYGAEAVNDWVRVPHR